MKNRCNACNHSESEFLKKWAKSGQNDKQKTLSHFFATNERLISERDRGAIDILCSLDYHIYANK